MTERLGDTRRVSGRAVRSDKQRNRRRILEAAETLMAERGAGVPLEEIARLAGIGSATMHRHFGSRSELIDAVFEGHASEIAAKAREWTKAPDPAQGLAEWLREVYSKASLVRGLARSLAGAPEFADGEAASCLAIVLGGGEELFAAAMRTGAVAEDARLDEVITIVIGIVLAVEEGVGADVDPARLVELVITRIVLRG